MRTGKALRNRSVFLNVPFDETYEPLFVALICSLVALGRIPRCVLEIPETGGGRLKRIFELIRSCSVSIHDLSRVGLPARFNMPFELGIAAALARENENHDFVILEAERHRLTQTLSDVNGIDPTIHGAMVKGVISSVLSNLSRPENNPSPELVMRIYRQLHKTVRFLKKSHGRSTIYSRSIFNDLVAGAIRLAEKEDLVFE